MLFRGAFSLRWVCDWPRKLMGNAARHLIAEPSPFRPADLKGRLPA